MHLMMAIHSCFADSADTALVLALALAGYILLGLLPLCGILYLVYLVLTLPMRRNERTRLFLDLLELGLTEGRTPEAAVSAAASASRDPALGARYQLLASRIQHGMRLGQALDATPGWFPLRVTGMLKAGERIGDVSRVLPACRRLLEDGVSHVRGALNYLLILAFVVTPFTVAIPLLLNLVVIPKFREVFAEMGEDHRLPAFSDAILSNSHGMTLVQVLAMLAVWAALIAYLGGPGMLERIGQLAPGLPGWIHFRLPWRRKRLQRDFSAMLAVLLDAAVPEPEAVRLAADATANVVFVRRAGRVAALLDSGVKLPSAIAAMDDSHELQWRLANALRTGGGFLRALTGWHDALDARAFQSEQAAAQVTTTLLVLFNGAVVGAIVIALFLPLINLINQAVLW